MTNSDLDLQSAFSFMLVVSFVFTLCYIANQWWLFLIIMILYLIRAGINQYNNNKVKKIRVNISNFWKFLILMIFIIQLVQIVIISPIIYVYDCLYKHGLDIFEVYEKLSLNDMLDKSIWVINQLYNSTIVIEGGDLIGRIK